MKLLIIVCKHNFAKYSVVCYKSQVIIYPNTKFKLGSRVPNVHFDILIVRIVGSHRKAHFVFSIPTFIRL